MNSMIIPLRVCAAIEIEITRIIIVQRVFISINVDHYSSTAFAHRNAVAGGTEVKDLD